ncbi:DUF1629 domain-containing protein [Sorangium sp. So ce281]|uniref:imm11 family protein n=1 Tax=unclassified Sorangium TaxID=2621164 RepID=UPI003F607A59
MESDIYALYGVRKNPPIPDNVDFLSGVPIHSPLPDPLVFEVNHPTGVPLGHLMGSTIPVASKRLVEVLRQVGVDNMQIFSALLRNAETQEEWSSHVAFNVIGMVNAVDREASKFDEIMPGPGAMPSLVDFDEVAISRAKAMDLRMFRIPDNPTFFVVHESVIAALRREAPPEGWGISAAQLKVQ